LLGRWKIIPTLLPVSGARPLGGALQLDRLLEHGIDIVTGEVGDREQISPRQR